MPELFQHDPDDSAFALPGDEQRLAALGQEPAADEPAAASPADTAPAEEATESAPATEEPEAAEAGEDAAGAEPDVDAIRAERDRLAQQYEEAQQMIGRQSNEVGELRRIAEALAGQQQQQPQQRPQYDPDQLEEWFLGHPTQIEEYAHNAFLAGDEAILDAALSALEQVDRPKARKLERAFATAQAEVNITARQQSQSQIEHQRAAEAQEYLAKHPEAAEYAPQMLELAQQYPNINALGSAEALDFLLTKARGQHADNLSQTARSIAREQAQEAELAIKDAAVASTTAVVAAPKVSAAQQIADEWDKADAPFSEGWNV